MGTEVIKSHCLILVGRVAGKLRALPAFSRPCAGNARLRAHVPDSCVAGCGRGHRRPFLPAAIPGTPCSVRREFADDRVIDRIESFNYLRPLKSSP
jgi:hypothetical protein